MSAAGLLAPAPAPAAAPPAPEYYPEDDEELESAEDDERSCRGRESDEGAVRMGAQVRGGGGRKSTELFRARDPFKTVPSPVSHFRTWDGVMPALASRSQLLSKCLTPLTPLGDLESVRCK